MTDTGKHVLENLRRAARYYGVYTRVAKRTGVTKQHVRFVAMGLRHSPRVERELIKEVRRIEREDAA